MAPGLTRTLLSGALPGDRTPLTSGGAKRATPALAIAPKRSYSGGDR